MCLLSPTWKALIVKTDRGRLEELAEQYGLGVVEFAHFSEAEAPGWRSGWYLMRVCGARCQEFLGETAQDAGVQLGALCDSAAATVTEPEEPKNEN